MFISKTPYRVSIFGGSTDYIDFYTKYDTSIIGFGLNYHVYVMANFISKVDEVNFQAFYTTSEKVQDISEFQNPAVRGSLLFLKDKFPDLNNISVHINNTLPSRSGIGSSSSLIIGILNAVYHLLGIDISKYELANYTNYIERKILCESGGYQDPFWASFGNIGLLDFYKNGQITYSKFKLSDDFINEFKRSSIIFYHSQRDSFNVASSYNDSDKDKYKLRIRDIAKTGINAFQSENITEIISLLKESWKEKSQISNLISNSSIDNINQIVMSNGGAMKVCGSGGGGMIFCMCDPSKRDAIISQVNLPTIDMDIDLQGATVNYLF